MEVLRKETLLSTDNFINSHVIISELKPMIGINEPSITRLKLAISLKINASHNIQIDNPKELSQFKGIDDDSFTTLAIVMIVTPTANRPIKARFKFDDLNFDVKKLWCRKASNG